MRPQIRGASVSAAEFPVVPGHDFNGFNNHRRLFCGEAGEILSDLFLGGGARLDAGEECISVGECHVQIEAIIGIVDELGLAFDHHSS